MPKGGKALPQPQGNGSVLPEISWFNLPAAPEP